MSARSVGEVPDALEVWCRVYREGGASRSEGDERAPFARALDAALGSPGRERETARALLACDALLTEVCARAASDPDPAHRLSRLLADLRGMERG